MSLHFPPDCAWLFAALTGEVPPDGDEDKMFALAEAHKDVHGKLTKDIQAQIADALGYTAKNFGGDAAKMYQEAMKAFLGGQEGVDYFNAVADQAGLIADFTRKSATQLQYTKYMIIAQLIELLIEAAVAAAMAFFFGASIAAYLQRQAIVKLILKTRLGRLIAMLLMHEVINVGMGVAMDGLVQWTQLNQGTRDEWDTDLTKNAAISGAVQGALAGPFNFLGDKFGKVLSKLFGKDAGKNIGNQLDGLMPPPKTKTGPKLGGPTPPPKPGGGLGPGGKPLPKTPPTSFGQDLSKVFQKNLPNTAGPGGAAAGKQFVKEMGDTFQKHFGGKAARGVGQDWAKTLLEKTGTKDLPKALEKSLEPLGKKMDPAVAKVLSQGTADALGKNILQTMVQGTSRGLFEGAHAAVSEGTYNLLFSDEHTFKTSGLTFGSGMVEGRLGHLLESGGEKLGMGLRNTLGMPPPSWAQGDLGVGTDLGSDTSGSSGSSGSSTGDTSPGGLTSDAPDLALDEFFAHPDDDLDYLDVDEDDGELDYLDTGEDADGNQTTSSPANGNRNDSQGGQGNQQTSPVTVGSTPPSVSTPSANSGQAGGTTTQTTGSNTSATSNQQNQSNQSNQNSASRATKDTATPPSQPGGLTTESGTPGQTPGANQEQGAGGSSTQNDTQNETQDTHDTQEHANPEQNEQNEQSRQEERPRTLSDSGAESLGAQQATPPPVTTGSAQQDTDTPTLATTSTSSAFETLQGKLAPDEGTSDLTTSHAPASSTVSTPQPVVSVVSQDQNTAVDSVETAEDSAQSLIPPPPVVSTPTSS
ncbi:hypothetical protein E4099_19210, partial [Streptomyces palmae]